MYCIVSEYQKLLLRHSHCSLIQNNTPSFSEDFVSCFSQASRLSKISGDICMSYLRVTYCDSLGTQGTIAYFIVFVDC